MLVGRKEDIVELKLDVYSDVICPWCFIGKRRLHKALAALGSRHKVDVTWRPFQLNPEMPREGIDRKSYRSAKFGSWEQSLALDAKVEKVGKAEGIPFAHERIQRTPNTFDAHRLVRLASNEGRQDAVIEALFRGYFVEGFDVGRPEALIVIAETVGLDAERVERFLASDDGAETVREEEAQAWRIGVTGVPFFVIEDKYSISGAQEVPTLVSALYQVARLAEEGSESVAR